MPVLRERLASVPEGSAALFFIQMFSTLGFAVLYSTLVLYTTRHLGFPVKEATAIMGVFGAFNYGLHLFGGYLGGRFLSNRNLFVGDVLLQVLGCATIALGTRPAWRLVVWIAFGPGVRHALRAVYRAVARRRHRWFGSHTGGGACEDGACSLDERV